MEKPVELDNPIQAYYKYLDVVSIILLSPLAASNKVEFLRDLRQMYEREVLDNRTRVTGADIEKLMSEQFPEKSSA